MSHGGDLGTALTPVPHGRLERLMEGMNRIVLVPCMLSLAAAAGILTYSVIVRNFLKVSTDWQDEAAVFLLVGATFFSGAYVQSYRGHIGIEAFTGYLSPRANRIRLLFVDLVTTAFCSFFTWKSWTLLMLAWREGQTTTSTWGPPLWIPYGLMAVGMTLFSLQAALHLVRSLTRGNP